MVNPNKAKEACGDDVSHKQYMDLRGPVVAVVEIATQNKLKR